MKQQQQKYLYKLHKEKEKGLKAHKYQKKKKNSKQKYKLTHKGRWQEWKRETKEIQDQQKNINKMAILNAFISIITLMEIGSPLQ